MHFERRTAASTLQRFESENLKISLRFFGDDFAVAPDIDRRAVETGRFASHARGAAECAANTGRIHTCCSFSLFRDLFR
jgi:hypothetical protein